MGAIKYHLPYGVPIVEHDIILRLIEYGVKKNTSFNLGQAYKDLGYNDAERKIVSRTIDAGHVLGGATTGIVELDFRHVNVWCTAADRFRLLEYKELQEARESASTAKKHALIAIGISIVAFIASVGFSIYQITTPVSLDQSVVAIYQEQTDILKKQLAATEQLNRDLSAKIEKLALSIDDTLQKVQFKRSRQATPRN